MSDLYDQRSHHSSSTHDDSRDAIRTNSDDNDDDDAMPKLVQPRGQRGGRRGKKHRAKVVTLSFSVTGVPAEVSLEELKQCVTTLLQMSVATPVSTPVSGPTHGKSPASSPSSLPPSPSISVSPLPTQASSQTYSATINYHGPGVNIECPMALPLGEMCRLESCATVCTPKGNVSVGGPALTLFGKVFAEDVNDRELSASILRAIHQLSAEACAAIKLFSRVETSCRTSAQFLIEAHSLQGSSIILNEVHDKSVTISGKRLHFCIESTTERGVSGERRAVYKPLFVKKEHRGKEWCAEDVRQREEHIVQIEGMKRCVQDGVADMPCLGQLPRAHFTPVPSPHLPHRHVQAHTDFPSEPLGFPSDPSAAFPSDLPETNVFPQVSDDINTMITSALSTVSSSVDLPWNQQAAVMWGAAAYAVVSGHWSPSTSGSGAGAGPLGLGSMGSCGGGGVAAAPTVPAQVNAEQNWKQLVSQLRVPPPSSAEGSMCAPLPAQVLYVPVLYVI